MNQLPHQSENYQQYLASVPAILHDAAHDPTYFNDLWKQFAAKNPDMVAALLLMSHRSGNQSFMLGVVATLAIENRAQLGDTLEAMVAD